MQIYIIISKLQKKRTFFLHHFINFTQQYATEYKLNPAEKKDICATRYGHRQRALPQLSNVLMVLKKTRLSKDIQQMTRTAICFSNETYTQKIRYVTFATIFRLPPNLKLLT